jgi:hypothetical protein
MKALYALTVMFVMGVVFFSLNNPTTSQNDLANFYADKDYIEGDIIVMFKTITDANAFVQNYDNISLVVKEVLVSDMNIYLLQYDTKKSQPVDALLSVIRNEKVAIAQFNHTFKERVIPNDTRFSEQWDKPVCSARC